jgi:Mitochondrial import protein Pam17
MTCSRQRCPQPTGTYTQLGAMSLSAACPLASRLNCEIAIDVQSASLSGQHGKLVDQSGDTYCLVMSLPPRPPSALKFIPYQEKKVRDLLDRNSPSIMAFHLAPRCLGSSSIAFHTGSMMPVATTARLSLIAAIKPRSAAGLSKKSFRSSSNTPYERRGTLLSRPASSPTLSCQRSSLTQLSSRPSSIALTSLRSALSIRHKSSSSNATSSAASRFSPAASSTTPASEIPKGSPSTLTWNEYLALRTRRRRINVLFSVICGLSSMSVGAAVIAAQDMESLNSFSFGLDPMIVLGAATMACGMVGWLLGPFLGGAVFGVLYRRVGNVMREVSAIYALSLSYGRALGRKLC